MHQIGLGYRSSFEALNQLARTIPGRKKRFEIVYSLVIFFHKALDHLHNVSNLQAEHEMEENQRLRKKRTRTEQSEYAVNKYLSSTLIAISQMEWKSGQLGHSEILEGILYTVLDHTGRLISHTVFNEHVAESDRPGNISSASPESSTEARKFEFRYIIPVLHAALGGSTRKELVARVLGDNRSNLNVQRRMGSSSVQDCDLLLKSKKVIQETLIKASIGAEVDALRLPTPPEVETNYSPHVGDSVEQFGPEWFLEAVWALVGWELAV